MEKKAERDYQLVSGSDGPPPHLRKCGQIKETELISQTPKLKAFVSVDLHKLAQV